MDNTLCNFSLLENPNRRYANTVNIVFFRAYPLNKNFQIYINGLKRWEGMMKKYYPESQLQLFVDRSIADDASIQSIMKKMNARIFLFDCPNFKLNDTFHMGLFGTLIRFFPIFDINTLPMKIAHIQELEPSDDFVDRFSPFEKASRMKFKNKLSFLYTGNRVFEKSPLDYYFEDVVAYPWMIAGRFVAFEKFPFKLLTDYLKDVKSGKKFLNIYERNKQDSLRILKEHDKYSFGIDESFLNVVLLPWLISNHKNIGMLVKYKISYPIFYSQDLIKKHKNSKEIFNYILNKKQNLNDSIKDFDTLFYKNENSSRAADCSKRFYEVVEKYPDWLGKDKSLIISKLFKGYLKRICVIVVRDNKLVEIKDIE